MKKYWTLYRAFLKASMVADLEYRANLTIRFVTDIFWYAAQILTFETIFSHTERVGSWNIEQTRVFLGILFVVDAFYMILFSENLDKMSDRVRKGELDLLLAKPVNSQFMLSTQRVNTAIAGNLILGISWLVYSLNGLPDFDPIRLLWLIALIPAGLMTLYAIRFAFCSTAIVFTRSENLQYLFFQLYRLGMRPDSIYKPWLKTVLMTALPVAFVASVPATAIMEAPQWNVFLWAILWSSILVYLSNVFWRFCLKHYSSASS